MPKHNLYFQVKISSVWHGDTQGWHVYMNGEMIYFTKDDRDKDMFIAELKGRLINATQREEK